MRAWVLVAATVVAAICVAAMPAAAEGPIVSKGQAHQLLSDDALISSQAKINAAVLRCLSRTQGEIQSVFNSMFDPVMAEDIYSEAQVHLAVIAYSNYLLKFRPGRMVVEFRRLEKDRKGLRGVLDDERLRTSYGIIGNAKTLLRPSAFGLIKMAGEGVLKPMAARLKNRSMNVVFEAYEVAYGRTKNVRRAWNMVDDWLLDTRSRRNRDLRYSWRTASAEMAKLSKEFGVGVTGEALLRRVIGEPVVRGDAYFDADDTLDGLLRSQLVQAKVDAAKAIADHRDVYQCVRDPNHRPDVYRSEGKDMPQRYRPQAPPGGQSVKAKGKLQDCLCKCLEGKTDFTCVWDERDEGDSPACKQLSNGPCICKAFGCFRGKPPQSGACHAACLKKHAG